MKKLRKCLIAFVGSIFAVSLILNGCVQTNEDVGTEEPSASQSQPVSVEPVITEAEYKSQCKQVSWKELCRYPENYKGQNIWVEVQIKQIMDADFLGTEKAWRAYADESGNKTYFGDEYYLLDCRGEDSIKVLKEDVLIIYGEFAGLKSISRALTGTEEELPFIEVKYADLVEFPSYEEVYNEYYQLIIEAADRLAEEFKTEAVEFEGDYDAVYDLFEEKNDVLYELLDEAQNKMYAYYSLSENGSYDEYEAWNDQLWDSYQLGYEKIWDAYMDDMI